jgi:acyl-CoA dehydrogenase
MDTRTDPAPAPARPASALRERVAAVLPVLREHAREVDDRAAFPQESLTALRRSGLMGLLVPAEYGGLGGTLADLVPVAATLSGACLSTGLIWAMHCQQVAALVAHARPGLRARLLPAVAAGEVYLASVTTERGKGGHLLTASAPLERAGDRLHLVRDAPIVTGGEYADGFLVTMRQDTAAAPDAVTLVYADRADLSIVTSGSWNPMGMRGTHSVALRLDGYVDEANIVGEPGQFRTVALADLIPAGHIGWAACWLGAAQGALRAVLALLRDPQARGQFDFQSDLLRTRLARARLDLDSIAALLSQVVRDVERGADLEAAPLQLRLNGLKVFAAERAFAVADLLVQVAGLRYGYLRDAPVPLERLFRDLRSASLNFANDRLLLANGVLTLMDHDVTLAWPVRPGPAASGAHRPG